MGSKKKKKKKSLSKFLEGMKELSSEDQKIYRPFQDLLNSIYDPTSLEEKTKVLISIGIAAYMRNEMTMTYHINEAIKLGAKEEEIIEAAMVSVISGGIGSMSFCVTFVKDAVDELKA